MAIPKKVGLRQIKVGAVKYYWTVKTAYESKSIKISIGEVNNQNKRLLIEAYHVNGWLTIGDKYIKKNEIEVVTPAFVKQAIEFAIEHKWNDADKMVLALGYENQLFKIKQKE